MKQETITIPEGVFSSVALFAAKKDIRFYLTGVCIDTGANGARLVATDGHAVAVAHLDDIPRPEAQFIINRAGVDTLAKIKGIIAIDCADLAGRYDGETVRVVQARSVSTIVTLNEIDGIFPDWRRVAVYKTPVTHSEPVFFRSELVARVQKAGSLLSKGPEYLIRPGEVNAVGYAELSDTVSAWVMPYRVKVDDMPSAPGWTL